MPEAIPEYAIGPLVRCRNSLLTALKMLRLCVNGIGIATRRPQMVQRIIDLTIEAGEEVSPDLKSDLDDAVEESAFASREANAGFPFLHALTLVGTWGALEAAVEDMLLGILMNEPRILEKEELSKIRMPVAKFELLEKEDRLRLLLSELQRAVSTSSARGADLFEKPLEIFGLAGTINVDIKKMLWEMNHLRNVIVHRDSIADLHLVQACPWLKLAVGDRVLIAADKYGLCSDMVYEYLKVLVRRLSLRYSVTAPEWALRARIIYDPMSPAEET